MAHDALRDPRQDASPWALTSALRVLPLPLWWLALRALGAHDDPMPLWQVAGMVLALAVGAAGAAAGSLALPALVALALISAGHAVAGAAEPWPLLLAAIAGALGPGALGSGARPGQDAGVLIRRLGAIALPVALWAWATSSGPAPGGLSPTGGASPLGPDLAGTSTSTATTRVLEGTAWTWMALLTLLGLLDRARRPPRAQRARQASADGDATATRRPRPAGASIRLNPLLWLAAELGDAIVAWLVLPAALAAPVTLLRLLAGRGAALAAEVGGHIADDLAASPLASRDPGPLQAQSRWVARQLAIGVALALGALGPHGWSALGGAAMPAAWAWGIAAGALATASVRLVAPVGLLAAGLAAAIGPVAVVLARPGLQLAVRALQRAPIPDLRSLGLTAAASLPGLVMAGTLAARGVPSSGVELTLALAAILVVHAVASVATWHLGVRPRG